MLTLLLRGLALALFLGAGVAGLRAQRVDEIAAIHVEAIGGARRVEALYSLRALGVVRMGGQEVRFTLLAARPNLVRLESESEGRARLQAHDGLAPAWELDLDQPNARARLMPAAEARTFVAEAEFDDPLVGGAKREFEFDFAGEAEFEGRKHFRILVTRRLTEVFTVLVDARTYLISARSEERVSANGRKVRVLTEFSDFRPVAGVLLAHQFSVSIDGRRLQETRIQRFENNVDLPRGIFSAPVPAVKRAPLR
jgi:hypothetical protein